MFHFLFGERALGRPFAKTEKSPRAMPARLLFIHFKDGVCFCSDTRGYTHLLWRAWARQTAKRYRRSKHIHKGDVCATLRKTRVSRVARARAKRPFTPRGKPIRGIYAYNSRAARPKAAALSADDDIVYATGTSVKGRENPSFTQAVARGTRNRNRCVRAPSANAEAGGEFSCAFFAFFRPKAPSGALVTPGGAAAAQKRL